MKNLSQASQYPNQLPTQTPPTPKSKALPLHKIPWEWGWRGKGSETDMEDSHAGIQEYVPEKELKFSKWLYLLKL